MTSQASQASHRFPGIPRVQRLVSRLLRQAFSRYSQQHQPQRRILVLALQQCSGWHPSQNPTGCGGVPSGRSTYHSAGIIAGFQPDKWHVEVTNLETHWCNESRKICSALAAMWRKPGGTLISHEEKNTYTGLTMCPHAAYGMPLLRTLPNGEGSALRQDA